MSLPRGSIRRPVAVAMLFAAVSFLGLLSFQRLPIDLLPDVAYPRLVVHTSYPDVAPAEVERFVTERIEQVVSTVPGVREVASTTREGTSLVTVRFAWGTDMDFAVLNVRERLDNLRGQLPERAARPVVLRTDPRSEPVLAVSVAGRADLHALKELAQGVFKRRLEQIDGVAEAAVTGGLEREIHVEVDPRRLESYGVTIADVTEALDAANASAPGGTVRRGRYRYALRTLGELGSAEEIAGVPVRRRGDAATRGRVEGAALTVGDVATVEDGFEERESIARYDGAEAVGLLVFKESGANTVRVAERVEAVLAELRAEHPDVRLEVAASQAGFIADAISNVTQALVLGGILAFLVLFLFLRDARYPVAIALAIPISVVATFALLDAAGVSLNIMSLGGLALGVGMLVDNSIVVLENIFRHRASGLGAIEAAARGGEEVQGAIAASTLTTVAVFGPIVYVEGVAGELFGALSLAVAFSLLCSLLVALTLLPAMAGRWAAPDAVADGGVVRRASRALARPLRRAVGRATSPLLDSFDRGFDRFTARYEALLAAALARRGRVVLSVAAMLGLSLALGLSLERDVLPDVDQGAFRARLELPPGTPLEETARLASGVEEALHADPAVASVFARVGRQTAVAGMDEERGGLHTAVLEVRLRAGESTGEVLERLRPRLEWLPEGALALESGQATALGRMLGGTGADLEVRVRGDDLGATVAHAHAVETALGDVARLTNVRLGTELGQPELRVEVDRERAAAYGVEPRRVTETVEAYMRGVVATELVEFDRRVPVVVRLPEQARRSTETLALLRVDGVPLRELVLTTEATGPAELRRAEQARVVPVLADVAAGGLDDALRDADAALAAVPAPAGVRVEMGGANEEMRRSFRQLGLAFALALLLVYMILAAQFESFVQPLVILLSVPLALVGAVLALGLSGGGLNSMSLIGMVILIGIAVNDAIIKVDFINQARARGLAVREAILEAGRARLRPIVMTSVTTVLGLTPMALGLGSGADLRAPLAVAVIGGLITATALTLLVVPVAYELVEDARRVRLPGWARMGVALGKPAAVERSTPELAPAGNVSAETQELS